MKTAPERMEKSKMDDISDVLKKLGEKHGSTKVSYQVGSLPAEGETNIPTTLRSGKIVPSHFYPTKCFAYPPDTTFLEQRFKDDMGNVVDHARHGGTIEIDVVPSKNGKIWVSWFGFATFEKPGEKQMADHDDVIEKLNETMKMAATSGIFMQGMQAYDNFASIALSNLLAYYVGDLEFDEKGEVIEESKKKVGKVLVEEREALAKAAWEVADAMMEERRKRGLGGGAGTPLPSDLPLADDPI